MVSALDSGTSGPGSSPGRGDCVAFLGKILYSHSASLHPGDKMLGGNLRWTSIPSRGVAILLVASCYRNRDTLRKLWATMLVKTFFGFDIHCGFRLLPF